jgi:isopentenyl-diphosphate delta-isomerase
MRTNQKTQKWLAAGGPDQNKPARTAWNAGGRDAIAALNPEKQPAVATTFEHAGYSVSASSLDSDRSAAGPRARADAKSAVEPFEDRLIVVNHDDEIVDYLPRAKCHAGDGILHRAFSIHIFNRQNQILLQQRSSQKQLWPLYWSNSCCSHPRAGETTHEAAQRRLGEELGISAALEYVYKFSYQARYNDAGSENELCSVFIGRHDGPLEIDDSEIADWRFVAIGALEHGLEHHPERFTPWFKLQWNKLRGCLKGRI